MKDKWKYLIGGALGWFLNSSTGTITNLIELEPAYDKLKTQYLYTPEKFDSTWSNNTEYIVDGAQLGLNPEGEELHKIVINLKTNSNGSISGVIYKKELCDLNPLTDAFYIESPPPSIINLVLDRYFFVNFLHNGKHEYLAKLKLEKYDSSDNLLSFKVVDDVASVFEGGFKLSAMLPAADDDIEEIEKYCIDKKYNFFEGLLRSGALKESKTKNSKDTSIDKKD